MPKRLIGIGKLLNKVMSTLNLFLVAIIKKELVLDRIIPKRIGMERRLNKGI